jgi:hypothetical protein
MKIKVVIERGADGGFSAYIADNTLPFGIIGEGKTAKETREDFIGGYEDMREYYVETGKSFPEVEFDFQFDMPSFLQYYAYAFTLAGMERITGVSQGQLSHYINGTRRPSERTVRKIEDRIHAFGAEISTVNFA